MKAGQLISFIAEGLPPEAQAALATLQADVPPMAPEPRRAGRPRASSATSPSASSSTGTRCRSRRRRSARCTGPCCRDGRDGGGQGAVPGRRPRRSERDLDNAEMLYGLFSSFALKGLDVEGLVDELRARMGDELDYRIEAANQTEFADRYAGHPFIRIPEVVPELSTRAGAHHRVGRRADVGRVRGDGRPRGASSAPARCSSASRRARSTATACSTATPTRATTGSTPTARDVPRLRPGEAVDGGRVGAPRRRASTRSSRRDPEWCVARDGGRSASSAAGHGLDPQLVYDYVEQRRTCRTCTTRSRSRAQFIARRARQGHRLNGPYADVIRSAQHAGVVRDPRPGRVGRERAARQARRAPGRGGASSRSTATARRPRRRSASSKRRPGALSPRRPRSSRSR